jgi:hypothetical protein
MLEAVSTGRRNLSSMASDDEGKPTGMLLEAVFGSEAIDSSGEILSVKGADISDLENGLGQINYEHFTDEQSEEEKKEKVRPSGNDWVGRVVFAKKIFSADDCANDRQLAFWKELELPFIYGIVRLYDRAGHPGAQALAAMIRDQHANKEKILWRWSVEGTTLKTSPDKKKLLESIVRVVALTRKPCNRSAETRLLTDPNAPEGFDEHPVKFEKDFTELKRSEHPHPNKTQLGAASYIYYDPQITESSLELLKGWQEDQAIERDAVEAGDPRAQIVGRPHAGPSIPPLSSHKIKGDVVPGNRYDPARDPALTRGAQFATDTSALSAKSRATPQVVGNEKLVPGKETAAGYQRAQRVAQAQEYLGSVEPRGPSVSVAPNPSPRLGHQGFDWDKASQHRFWAAVGHSAFNTANPIPPFDLSPYAQSQFQRTGMYGPYTTTPRDGTHIRFEWAPPHVGAGGGTAAGTTGTHIKSYIGDFRGLPHAQWSARGNENVPFEVNNQGSYELFAPEVEAAIKQHLQSHLQKNPRQLQDLYDTWERAGFYTNPQQGLHFKSEPDLAKTITAGNYDAAPGSLSGGAALQVEDRGLRARAKAALRDHTADKGPFKTFLKARLPEASDEFLDRFSGLVEDFKFKKAQLLMQKVEPSAQAAIRKFEALTIELKKMSKRGFVGGGKLESTEVKPEHLPDEIEYQGRKIKPGLAVQHNVRDRGLAVLHTDKNFHVAVRFKPGDDLTAGWNPEDMVKLDRRDEPSRYSLKSHPVDVQASPVTNGKIHGTDLNLSPEQQKLAHGLDFGKVGAKGNGWNADRSYWLQSGDGKPVFAKGSLDRSFDDTHKEVAFYNVAKNFFGLGDHLPVTAQVLHPRSNHEMVVQEKVKGEHVDVNIADPRHATALDSALRSGELDKLMFMDAVLGNDDRHAYNWMMGEDGHVKLIDHGETLHPFESNDGTLPTYIPRAHYAQPPHPDASAWALKLKPEELLQHLQASRVPPDNANAAVWRLQRLQRLLSRPQGSTRMQVSYMDEE